MIYQVYRDDGHKTQEKRPYRLLLAFNTYDGWSDFKDQFDPKAFPDRRNPRLTVVFYSEQVRYYNDAKDNADGVCL